MSQMIQTQMILESQALTQVKDWVNEHIEASNANIIPDFPGSIIPFALTIKNKETGESLGGMYGQLWMQALHIERLFVVDIYRRQGIGKKMMTHAEMFANKHGCHMVTLDSLSFQSAVGFYLKLGFDIAWEEEGYMHDIRIFHLRKLI